MAGDDGPGFLLSATNLEHTNDQSFLSNHIEMAKRPTIASKMMPEFKNLAKCKLRRHRENPHYFWEETKVFKDGKLNLRLFKKKARTFRNFVFVWNNPKRISSRLKSGSFHKCTCVPGTWHPGVTSSTFTRMNHTIPQHQCAAEQSEGSSLGNILDFAPVPEQAIPLTTACLAPLVRPTHRGNISIIEVVGVPTMTPEVTPPETPSSRHDDDISTPPYSTSHEQAWDKNIASSQSAVTEAEQTVTGMGPDQEPSTTTSNYKTSTPKRVVTIISPYLKPTGAGKEDSQRCNCQDETISYSTPKGVDEAGTTVKTKVTTHSMLTAQQSTGHAPVTTEKASHSTTIGKHAKVIEINGEVPQSTHSPQHEGHKAPHTAPTTGHKAPHTTPTTGHKEPHNTPTTGHKAPHTTPTTGHKAPRTTPTTEHKAPHTTLTTGHKAPHTTGHDTGHTTLATKTSTHSTSSEKHAETTENRITSGSAPTRRVNEQPNDEIGPTEPYSLSTMETLVSPALTTSRSVTTSHGTFIPTQVSGLPGPGMGDSQTCTCQSEIISGTSPVNAGGLSATQTNENTQQPSVDRIAEPITIKPEVAVTGFLPSPTQQDIGTLGNNEVGWQGTATGQFIVPTSLPPTNQPWYLTPTAVVVENNGVAVGQALPGEELKGEQSTSHPNEYPVTVQWTVPTSVPYGTSPDTTVSPLGSPVLPPIDTFPGLVPTTGPMWTTLSPQDRTTLSLICPRCKSIIGLSVFKLAKQTEKRRETGLS